MSFQPVVPLTGYVGWRFLERTIESQQTAFSESQPITRATDYFRENIGNVHTAEELVNNRQLLEVTLGAFGLDDDIDNKAFIQKILEDGATDDDALANRLTDTRYADLADTFGFDNELPRINLSFVQEDVIDRFEKRQFEAAVGEQNNDLRLALNIAQGVADVTDDASGVDAQWFSVMGNAPLRSVFETALGLSSSIASIDIDDQLTIFQERAQSVFGTDSVTDFNDPEIQEKLVRLFLIKSEAANVGTISGASTALALLQSGVS